MLGTLLLWKTYHTAQDIPRYIFLLEGPGKKEILFFATAIW